MKKLRVLIMLGEINRGGVETTLLRAVPQIINSGIELELLKLDYEGEVRGSSENEFENLGVKINRPRVPKNIPVLSKEAKIIIQEGKYDLVISTMFRANPLLKIAKSSGAKTLMHSHRAFFLNFTNLIKLPEQFASALLFKNCEKTADTKLAVSKSAAISAFSKNTLSENDFSILPNPILEPDIFKFKEKNRKTRRDELGVKDNQLLLGFAGRLEPQKNIPFIYLIKKELDKLGVEAKFLFIGDGSLRPMCELFGTVTGSLDKQFVNEYLNALDIFLIPSLFEGFPTSLIEAQAAGLPALVADNIDKDVDLKLTGIEILFLPISKPKQQAEAWAKEIINLSQNLPNSKQKAAASKNALKSNYEVKKAATELISFWKKAVN